MSEPTKLRQRRFGKIFYDFKGVKKSLTVKNILHLRAPGRCSRVFLLNFRCSVLILNIDVLNISSCFRTPAFLFRTLGALFQKVCVLFRARGAPF